MNEAEGYRVLARKYRPARFEDLIGQEPMVRTLRNAFVAGRIPHAWMLTGVRGVGKTTTARILARALNFEREDGGGEPTIDLEEEGVHGPAILAGHHPDVIEMDAASHTGIDDIRDIIDSAHYAPASARYKVFIIDEVHMLSKQAFNGLLKTLEEPPEHVKFIFATTEIRKVPVTILSRCQRFDLRRVDADTLREHLASISEREGVEADDEGLAMIARAAEGSVRDALSVLDQAIAHGAGRVEPELVRSMLGLSDRSRIIDLFEWIMKGNTAGALAELAEQYDSGADPATVLGDLAEFCHFVTRLKLAPEVAARAALSQGERERGAAFASNLSLRVLARAWQIIAAGLPEVESSARPLAAADMLLVRLCHAADLPTPDEALRRLDDEHKDNKPRSDSGRTAAMRSAKENVEAEAEPASKAQALCSFEEIVALARAKRHRLLVYALERQVRAGRLDDNRIALQLLDDAPSDLPQTLSRFLQEQTGARWFVTLSDDDGEGAPTLHERMLEEKAARIDDVRADPLVEAVLQRFPDAEIVEVRDATGQAVDADSGQIEDQDRDMRNAKGTPR